MSPSVEKFEKLREMLQSCASLGMDLSGALKKIELVIATLSSEEINIALIGSFSDGKTSAIAGLLGEVLSNMKISPDESSDEIEVYLYDALGKHFRIVDTPGLFGTKEKEIEGVNVRFSEKTTQYLSEAHIVLYVCDAVNPLRDSHVATIKYIMKDLKKLESAIFVINKMDEAGYDLRDDEDFERGKNIKTQTLQKRLAESLQLSEDEVKALNIVCIAADPKGRGVEKWMTTQLEEYLKRSHIDDFKQLLRKVVAQSNKDSLKQGVEYASVLDVVANVDREIEAELLPSRRVLEKLHEGSENLSVDLNLLKQELSTAKRQMIEELDGLKNSLIRRVKAADLPTIGAIIEEELGVKGEEVTMHLLERNVNMIRSEYSEANRSRLKTISVKLERNAEAESSWIKEQLKTGAKLLGKVKVDAKMVKAARDVFAKGVKFKPWGAVNLGKNITKGLAGVGVGLSVIMEGVEIWQSFKDAKKLDEIREAILKGVREAFDSITSDYADPEAYYRNFAPHYIDLRELLEKREQEVEQLKNKLEGFEQLKEKLRAWSRNAEYAEFEEIS